MSTEEKEPDIIIKVVEAIDAMDKRITDVERRSDEVNAATKRELISLHETDRKEIITAINQLSEGMRALAEQKGSSSDGNNIIKKIVELATPAIQARIMPGSDTGAVTGETSKLADLVALGITREINSDLKLRARGFLRKGRLFTNEVVAAGVDGVIDKATENHARI